MAIAGKSKETGDNFRDREIAAKKESDGSYSLQTTANVTILGGVIPVEPATNVIYKNGYCTNGLNVNLNVDGSVTPVEFTYSPGAGSLEYIDFLSALIYDSGNNSFSGFGVGPRLTNGVKLDVKTKGIVYNLGYLFDNKDFILTFSGNFGAQGNGGFAPDDSFWGSFVFRVPIVLDESQGDYFKVTVQDDLSGFNNIHFVVHNWILIP